MAVVKRVVELDIVANPNKKSDYFGKYYARIHYIEPLNLRGLCEHILSHGSPFTRDVVEGVVTRLRNCIVELLSEGQGVKLDGLGTLRPTLENATGGADSIKDFNVTEHVTGVHVRFIPEGEELDRLTSREMMKNCVLRKTYEVTYSTIMHGGKEMKVPSYTPIKKPSSDESKP